MAKLFDAKKVYPAKFRSLKEEILFRYPTTKRFLKTFNEIKIMY